jgi:hypothetical protein
LSPADAAALTEEPNWRELWEKLKVADDGFEAILTQWRRWHWIPGDEYRDEHGQMRVQKIPASAVSAIIALAALGIMPIRSIDWPHSLFEDELDAHCWLVTEGRAWRILGIEDKTLFLDSFGETRQIDLARAKWDKYCEAAAAVLEAARQ